MLLRTSQLGIEFITKWEGVRLSVYKDAAGLKTIGVGHLIRPGEIFSTITLNEAYDLLAKDLSTAEDCVNQSVKGFLKQNEFDALVSFVFNVGTMAFRRSTMLKYLNKAMNDLAAAEFSKWNKAGGRVVQGLSNRRAAEKKLFQNGYY